MKLVYLYNQIGAGPLMISSLLTSQLSGNNDYIIIVNDRIICEKSSNIIVFKTFDNLFFKLFYRFLIEIFYLSVLSIRKKCNKLIAFGNFNFILYPSNRTVLVHHPYLNDDRSLNDLPYIDRILERAKRTLFKLNVFLFPSTRFVCQSSDYLNSLYKRYKLSNVSIIPNPFSNNFPRLTFDEYNLLLQKRLLLHGNNHVNLLYVSRYYPHKNFELIISLADSLDKCHFSYTITLTLDLRLIPISILDFINSNPNIINVGELSQSSLLPLYQEASICIFPSKSETFGNGLIEAASFGLPVITEDLPFAQDVLSGLALTASTANDYLNHINLLLTSDSFYTTTSRSLYDLSRSFLSPN